MSSIPLLESRQIIQIVARITISIATKISTAVSSLEGIHTRNFSHFARLEEPARNLRFGLHSSGTLLDPRPHSSEQLQWILAVTYEHHPPDFMHPTSDAFVR